MRRVADPYRVNSHKLLPKPRADNIRPYTSAIYVSRRVFTGEQNSPCGVSLAAALQIPIYQSVYTTKVPAASYLSGLKINIRVATGNFYFSDSSLKLFIMPSTPAEKVDAVCAPMENIS